MRLFRRVLCRLAGHAPGDALYRREPIGQEAAQNPRTRPAQAYVVVGHVCDRCDRQVPAAPILAQGPRRLWPWAVLALVVYFGSPRYDVVGDEAGATLVRTSRITGRSERLDGAAGWLPFPSKAKGSGAASTGEAVAVRVAR